MLIHLTKKGECFFILCTLKVVVQFNKTKQKVNYADWLAVCSQASVHNLLLAQTGLLVVEYLKGKVVPWGSWFGWHSKRSALDSWSLSPWKPSREWFQCQIIWNCNTTAHNDMYICLRGNSAHNPTLFYVLSCSMLQLICTQGFKTKLWYKKWNA